jgi:hypothetical protein
VCVSFGGLGFLRRLFFVGGAHVWPAEMRADAGPVFLSLVEVALRRDPAAGDLFVCEDAGVMREDVTDALFHRGLLLIYPGQRAEVN